MVSISPTGETKENSIRIEARAPFFLQKGPSRETSRRDISQFTPENAPYGKGDFAHCDGRPRASRPWTLGGKLPLPIRA